MPSVTQLHTSLLETIDAAPEHHLRMVLQSLCTDSKTMKRALDQFKNLKALENPKKRKATADIVPVFSICTRCNQRFDETDNTARACTWHPGNREVDFESDVWMDIWEGGYEAVDFEDKDTIAEFPEGYRWDCCDEYGDHEGCVDSLHQAKEVNDWSSMLYKRTRLLKVEGSEA
ncbi:hypothetical protein ABW20_dc0104829 [Dactylellina cionopaga]|nr:hypothetical protein ABW20_dc0104829 [Dactylellina cionopaga]